VKLSIRSIVVAGVIAVLPQIASGQSADPVGKWFSDRKIAVRKTFEGGKDEQNPASLFLVRDPGGQDKEFASIDVALKTTEKEWKPGDGSFLFYPVFDYHRSTNSAQLVHKMGAAGRIEYQLTGSSVAPVFLFDAKASHDWAIYRNESRIGLQFFLKSNKPGFPGSDNAKSWGFYRYYAYLGAERDWFEAEGDDTTMKAGFARAWVEIWPSFGGTEFLQFTIDGTSRYRIGEQEGIPKNLSDATLGATVYLDGHGHSSHVGIGVDYANGRDATVRFARRERVMLSLKVKF